MANPRGSHCADCGRFIDYGITCWMVHLPKQPGQKYVETKTICVECHDV